VASGDRLHQFAAFGQGALHCVDVDARAHQRRVVGLPHLGGEGADEIEMLAGTKPRSLHQGSGRQSRAADDVGPAHGGLEIVDRLDIHAPSGEASRHRLRAFEVPAPYAHRGDGTRRDVGVDDVRRQRARAHHEQPARVRPREIACRERGSGRRAAPGQFGAVQHRQRAAVGGIEQRIHRVHRRAALGRVAGKHGDQLDADASPRLPRGHREQQVLAGVADGVVLPRRRVNVGAKGALQRVDQRHATEPCRHLTAIEI